MLQWIKERSNVKHRGGALPVGPNRRISRQMRFLLHWIHRVLVQCERVEEEVGIDDSDDYNDHNND